MGPRLCDPASHMSYSRACRIQAVYSGSHLGRGTFAWQHATGWVQRGMPEPNLSWQPRVYPTLSGINVFLPCDAEFKQSNKQGGEDAWHEPGDQLVFAVAPNVVQHEIGTGCLDLATKGWPSIMPTILVTHINDDGQPAGINHATCFDHTFTHEHVQRDANTDIRMHQVQNAVQNMRTKGCHTTFRSSSGGMASAGAYKLGPPCFVCTNVGHRFI